MKIYNGQILGKLYLLKAIIHVITFKFSRSAIGATLYYLFEQICGRHLGLGAQPILQTLYYFVHPCKRCIELLNIRLHIYCQNPIIVF